MSHAACFLCSGEASLGDEDQRTVLTAVNCLACGPYSLTPQTWTADERLSLAAYVRHENRVGRGSTTITRDNHRLLIGLGERLRAKKKGAGQ
jgi:hypothetical protein